MMEFETFFNGAPLHYMVSDNIRYVETVKGKCTTVTRADGAPVEVLNAGVTQSYPDGYTVGHGEWSARMMHEEALRYPVVTAKPKRSQAHIRAIKAYLAMRALRNELSSERKHNIIGMQQLDAMRTERNDALADHAATQMAMAKYQRRLAQECALVYDLRSQLSCAA